MLLDHLEELSLLPILFFVIGSIAVFLVWFLSVRSNKSFKHSKWLAIFWVCAWMFFCHVITPYPIVAQEELSSLDKREDILYYAPPRKNQKINGYYFRNKDGTCFEISFRLCDQNLSIIPKYEGQRIVVWYKGNWVYQMEYNGEVVLDITEGNRRAKYVTISNFLLFFSLIPLFLFLYLCNARDLLNQKGDVDL